MFFEEVFFSPRCAARSGIGLLAKCGFHRPVGHVRREELGFLSCPGCF